MRRPAGVIIAAIILGIFAAIGLLGTLVSFVTTVLIHNPVVPQMPGVKAILAIFDGVVIAWCCFCLWVVVGLIRLRNWARISMIVIGVLTAVFCALLCALMFVVRHSAPALPGAQANTLPMLLLAVAVLYGIIGIIGVWWLVYFSQGAVRLAFVGQATAASLATPGGLPPAPSRSGWEIVVLAYAWLIIVGSVMMLAMPLLHFPLYVFGMVLRGPAAVATTLIWAGASLFAGIGLLRRIRAGYWTAVGLQIFGVISLLSFLLPGARERMMAAQAEIQQRISPLGAAQTPGVTAEAGFITGMIAGVLVVGLFLIALLRCRQIYAPSQPGLSPSSEV